MATATLVDSAMRLELDGGLDADNKPVMKYKTFAHVRINSTPDQLEAVGTALAGLQIYPLVGIRRNDALSILR
ncbi:DUF1659 domain-containing protein [Fictibacillus phosphorivorans]|uniref:DUF1659 domain-containing protein n=1 Tax=Fictibacillus phosphorivorans TaxID=1221500 RepID=UPI00203FEA20|nr:DUF1659 domain-containing protein [Fictibacillus phosphorivorans]MCM3717639.1 DUF1659 domain-containing protein [Fictibacillus phosphorivorans]MCM3775539.1 DUF1659 domain-containing protein [Fictibacillus phosphorivorans]